MRATVKGEAARAPFGLRVAQEEKIRLYIFNKKLYGIFKKHINRCNTEVNVLFCLRDQVGGTMCSTSWPGHVVCGQPIRSSSRFNYVKCQIAIN